MWEAADNFTLTLFTPTYNRAHLLMRLYESLCAQDSKDFLWMVVDDGSTDETERLIRGYMAEDVIPIEYHKKPNGGKHTAYNRCMALLKSELVLVAMDSDDWLKPDAVASVLSTWHQVKDNASVKGIVFLKESGAGEPLISKYEDEALAKMPSLQEARINNWFYGEAEYVFRTEYVRQFLYPERAGEHFFNEAYTYVQMTGRMLWVKKCICVCDYQRGGLSDSFLQNVIRSPLSYADYSNMMAKWEKKRGTKTKYALYYDVFSIFGGAKGFLVESTQPLSCRLLVPVAWVISLALRVKKRQY